MAWKWNMAQTPSQSLRQIFGTTEKPANPQFLKAGSLSVEFLGGALGAIRFKGVEVLRGISYLVRDENWGTCAAALKTVKAAQSRNGFQITFEAKSSHGGSTLSCTAVIKGSPRRLTFTVSAIPGQDFRTNRTGFVVLHPINGVAGKPLTVTHFDGGKTRAKFPKFISPGQPFFNIRALEHSPAPGLKAHVLMEGNKFEMEDQRNWSDASFKTYVCSLLDPWPYTLKAGDRFDQRVTLTINGDAKRARGSAAPIVISDRKPNARLPEIGLALSEDDAGQTLQHLDDLKALSPRFLLCTHVEGWTTKKTLDLYAVISRETGIAVRLELILSAKKPAEEEMRSAAAAMHLSRLAPSAVIVTHAHDLKSFQPTDIRPWGPSYEDMAEAARACFPGIPIGGGMASYFTEFNRKPPPRGVFDFLTHSICPIVHDASDAAVMQTLETLPHIFASAKEMIGKTPYHLGPTTIAARMNPYGNDVSANPENRRVCLAPNDPRQFAEFAVTWNLGLIAAAARAGLQSVTLDPLCGPRGLIGGRGELSPLYRFVANILPACGLPVSYQQLGALSVLARSAGHAQFKWAGNLGSEPVSAFLSGRPQRLSGYCSSDLTPPSPPPAPAAS
jgi:D-apionolactonase